MIWNTGDRKRGIDAFLTTGSGTASSDEREARESLSRHTPGPRAVSTCGQHAARPQTFAFAQQSFLAYPDPLMSRRASRPSNTFFLPHQTKPKELL